MKYLVTILVCLAFFTAPGQNIQSSNLKWNVSGLTDLGSNTMNAAYTCSFKTSGSSTIVWEQNRGYNVTFIVTSMKGSWTDVSNLGKVVYSIAVDGNSGTLTFEKSSVGTFITMSLSQKSGRPLTLKYSVNQVTNL